MFIQVSASHANRLSKPRQQRSFLTSLLQTNNLLALLQRLRRPFKQLLLFDTGKAVLKPEARDTLHEAAERVKKFAGAAVLVSGHTDDVGSDASNQALSERRAAAVKDYFVGSEDIDAGTLATWGFGSTQPVADNGTDAGRARNRRVDVVITPRKE